MKSVFRIIVFTSLFTGYVAVAQQMQQPPRPIQAPVASVATTAPAIPLELLKNFYAADATQQRAQRELDQAQRAVQSANDVWKQAVDAMQKVCGEKFLLYQDSVNSDPQCKDKAVVGAHSATPKEKK